MTPLTLSWRHEPPDPLPGPVLSHFQTHHRAELARAYGQDPQWLWATRGGRAVGSWLLFTTPGDYLNPPRRRATRALDVHLRAVHSPAIDPDADREEIAGGLLEAVRRRAERLRPLSVSLALDPVTSAGERAMWSRLGRAGGWQTAPSWTYLAHLPGTAEELDSQIKRDRRKSARKADKEGVVCEEVSSADGLREYFPLREQTAVRNGNPPVPWDHFAATWDALSGSGVYRVFLARRDGRAAAGQLAFTWNDYVYLTGVSIAQWAIDEKLPANDALQWHVLHAAQAEGRTLVDFGGAQPQSDDPKLKAIDAFKARWGTTLEESVALSLPGSRVRSRAWALARRLER